MVHLKTGQVCLVLLICIGLFKSGQAKLTDKERDTINNGIEAGKKITSIIETTKDFGKTLTGIAENVVPWLEGISMFCDFLGMFLPEENEMLEEMKKGFQEVNKRLDAIKDAIDEVKEAIDWAVVKINFQEIESNIRVLDQKLKEVMIAPNPDHGMEEYVRVYEDEYDEAGLKLYDSIVNNDQVFYENILTAGMRYTEYTRSVHQNYMRGLIALMMKSANIEVSYERFKEHDRGMAKIWEERLDDMREAMEKADDVLENKWEDLFRNEVNERAKACEGCSHEQFRDIVYNHLATKYYWRYWSVLSYDDVGGWDNHAITHHGKFSHVVFRYHKRNFAIATSDNSMTFDRNHAKSLIIDRTCPSSVSDCKRNAAKKLMEVSPFYGVLNAAVAKRFGWAVVGVTSRVAWGNVYVRQSWWAAEFSQFYFG